MKGRTIGLEVVKHRDHYSQADQAMRQPTRETAFRRCNATGIFMFASLLFFGFR